MSMSSHALLHRCDAEQKQTDREAKHVVWIVVTKMSDEDSTLQLFQWFLVKLASFFLLFLKKKNLLIK